MEPGGGGGPPDNTEFRKVGTVPLCLSAPALITMYMYYDDRNDNTLLICEVVLSSRWIMLVS